MRKVRFRRVNRGGFIRVSGAVAVLCIAFLMTSAASAQEAKPSTQNPGNDWKPVQDAMGRPGQVTGDVIRFGMPRKDLHVTINGVAIKPGLALGAWTAFKRVESGAMVMGDLVLTEDEVDPVMRKLRESGIEVAAAQKHVVGETARGVFMHLVQYGDVVTNAQTCRADC